MDFIKWADQQGYEVTFYDHECEGCRNISMHEAYAQFQASQVPLILLPNCPGCGTPLALVQRKNKKELIDFIGLHEVEPTFELPYDYVCPECLTPYKKVSNDK